MARSIRVASVLAILVVRSAAGAPALAGASDRRDVAPVSDAAECRKPTTAARAPLPERPPSDVPLDHWAYPLLERLVARRILWIDLSTLPVSRAVVGEALLSRRNDPRLRDDPTRLTEREEWALGRLEDEFLGGRIDAPVLSLRDGEAVVSLGVVLGTGLRHVDGCAAECDSVTAPLARGAGGNCEAVCGTADIGYELWGGVGGVVGFYSDATILLEGQEGPRMARLSKRTRTWRGVAATIDRAYVKFERPHLTAALGRRGPAWGRSRRGGLLLSGTAQTFDQIDASLEVGRFRFLAFHAMLEYDETGDEEALEPGDAVFLAGHRLVFCGRDGSVGLNEVVVYSSGIPDPAYLNPLLPYYVSQHNERADDNVLWSADFDWRPAAGLDVYGEFLVDDLQYDRETGIPDKYAFTIGNAYYSHAFGVDYELVSEYSQARRWTYTHDRVEHRYAHDGRPIGFELGPDADRALVGVTLHPAPAWSVAVGYEHARKGEGTIGETFERGTDSDPPFPSGDVLTVRRITVAVVRDDLAGFSYGFRVAYDDRAKGGDGSGDDEGGWEVWVGAAFRI